jgi:hypothetical protein
MKQKYRFFGMILMMLFSLTAMGQQRFGAGIIVGLNAAQVNGDDLAGYNKLGLRGGLRGITYLSDKTEINIDILFSQRGSASELVANNSLPRRLVNLNYIEVPVTFTFKDWQDERGFYKVHFQGGLAYSRLISSKVDFFAIIESEQDNFAANDLAITLAGGFYVNESFGLNVRWSRSIFPFYDNDKHLNSAGLPRYKFPLTGFFLSFEGVYLF